MKLTNRSYSISFIAQSYTWSRLQISEQLFRKLVTRLRVHPAFLDVVHLFSEKVGPVEESFNHFFANFSVQPSLQSPLGSEQGSYGKRRESMTRSCADDRGSRAWLQCQVCCTARKDLSKRSLLNPGDRRISQVRLR